MRRQLVSSVRLRGVERQQRHRNNGLLLLLLKNRCNSSRPHPRSSSVAGPDNAAASICFPQQQQRRFLSINTTTTKSSSPSFTAPIQDLELSSMRHKAQQILEQNNNNNNNNNNKESTTFVQQDGSETSSWWWEVQDVLEWWTLHPQTCESIQISLQLLEHCVQKQSGTTTDATLFLDRELLDTILHNYHVVYKQQQNENVSTILLHPMELFETLEEWCLQCPTLSVSGKALSWLLDATYRQQQNNNNNTTTDSQQQQLAQFCETLLDRMLQDGFIPSATNLNVALHAWAKVSSCCCDDDDTNAATKQAEDLVHRMMEAGVELDIISYNSLLQVYRQQGQGEHAQALWHELVSAWLDDNENAIRPNLITLNSTLGAWSRSNDPQAPERAQDLLRRIVDPKDDYFQLGLMPDVYTLNAVLLCWARCSSQDNAAERAYQVLQEMKELTDAGVLNAGPDSYSYSIVLNAFAKSGNPGKAEALLSVMYSKYMQGDSRLKPTVWTLTLILEAWARSDVPSRMERAEAIFGRMQELYEDGFLESGPDTTAYNVMLNCYAASSNQDDNAADRAVELLERMKKEDTTAPEPDFKTYAIVIRTLLQRNDGTDRAYDLLMEAYNGYLRGNAQLKPNIHSVNAIIRRLGRERKAVQAEELLNLVCDDLEHGRSTVKPDVISFGSMVAALSVSDDANAANRADAIVSRMISMHESGLLDEGPDYMVYRAWIHCWAMSKLPGAGKKAHTLLRQIRRHARLGESDMQPDTISYNQVIQSLARARAPAQAEELLQQMYDDYRADRRRKAKPNRQSFNHVLSAWSRFKTAPYALQKVQSLIEHMQALYESGTLDVKPDRTSFSHLIFCWSKSNRPDSGNQAQAILRFMQAEASRGDERLQPNASTYGGVIKAWISVDEPYLAEQILMEMYNEYKAGCTSCKPEKKHFEVILQAYSRLGDAESVKRIRDVKLSLGYY